MPLGIGNCPLEVTIKLAAYKSPFHFSSFIITVAQLSQPTPTKGIIYHTFYYYDYEASISFLPSRQHPCRCVSICQHQHCKRKRCCKCEHQHGYSTTGRWWWSYWWTSGIPCGLNYEMSKIVDVWHSRLITTACGSNITRRYQAWRFRRVTSAVAIAKQLARA